MDKRTEIISQAVSLFAAYGYEGVSVQQIVKAAEVTKPTLYYYFDSKRGLLKAVLQQYFDVLYTSTQATGVYEGDLTITLRKIATAYIDFASEHTLFYRMQLSLLFSPPQSEAYATILPLKERQYELLENMFREAAKQHGNMQGRQKEYTVSFLGTLNAYIEQLLNQQKASANDELVNRLVHQFMHGILS
ncbi:AcrR family transcriptional regulator [Catalinimonas alkaloidigena]|uniref:TetR/AcrR family transcriptional regulator n=1 Tax=Catalinimonas alkaloidigena TaxID=1075417 RepID=UPI002406E286|nr:TetR/AcrR family transcriptional regulator [Catalinimonas alkaloidigena]MDF9795071.1 AcrR family transcriptional regulator [Catalinimonas alkaloidigena]